MSSEMKKIKYQAGRVGSCFNHVIELNEKMLRFATKKIVYVMMTYELFIKYFCNIKLFVKI